MDNEISGGVFFQAVIQGRDITLALPPQITPAMSGLPAPTPTFTGRDTKVTELLAVLSPSEPREQRTVLVAAAVAGLAGVGKTELVVHTAARALAQPGWFPGGVLFVDLFGYDPERRVPPEAALAGLLQALGIPGEHIPATLQDRSRLYRSVLAAFAEQGRRVLVVIDNVSSADQAHPMIPTDGTTATLITSRHTLDLGARLHDLDVLDIDESVDLLDQALQYARAGDTRFQEQPEDAAAVARLCAGLPLALRISAALLADTPTRPLGSLAAALEAAHTRLDRLSREDRAVRAAFDLSYQHLDPAHARLFRLLPLSPGPDLSTQAAAHLADVDEHATEAHLTDLARAHLIEPGTVWGRWRLHDLVRLHADHHGRDQSDADHREAALTRLLTHYQTTARMAVTHLQPPPAPPARRFADRKAALTWLDDEHVNLIATAQAASGLGHPATTLALTDALGPYLNYRHHFDEWITLATRARDMYQEVGDLQGATSAWNNLGLALREVRRFEEAVTAHTHARDLSQEVGDRHSEAMVWNNLGSALLEVRRFEEAVTAHTHARDLHQEVGNQHGVASAWNNLGVTLREVRRFEESVTAHTRSRDMYRELGDQHSEATAWNNLGLALLEARRSEEAIAAHTHAREMYRELGDRHNETMAWNNLGLALLEVRRFEEAIAAHTHAVDVFRELGDRYREAMVWNNLGLALLEVRRFEEAVTAHTHAVDVFRELGDQHQEASAWDGLGLALLEVRRFEEAIAAHTRARDLLQEVGDQHQEASSWNNLGLALLEVRRFEEAIAAHTHARDLHQEVGDRHGVASAWSNLGSALLEVRRFEEAVTAHTRAADVFRELGDQHSEAMAWGNLGVALLGLRRSEEAITAHTRAADFFRELGDRHSEAKALSNLGVALGKVRQFEKAVTAHTRARDLFQDLGDRHNADSAIRRMEVAHNERWLLEAGR